VALRKSSENEAHLVVAAMLKGKVVDLLPPLAIAASKLGLDHSLPMADTIILATAREEDAPILTLGFQISRT